jgi:O-antigen/teichoic acid export membrane protein
MQVTGEVKAPRSEQNVDRVDPRGNAILDSPARPSQTQQFRSHVGHISRQSGVFFAGTVFTAVAGYAFKVYLARVLGAEALGIYALGMTLIGFLGIFNALGLPQAAVRFVASYRASQKFAELHAVLWRGTAVLLLSSAASAIFLLIAGPLVATHFYHSPALVRYLPYFASLTVFAVLSGYYGKVLAGYKDLTRRTVIVSFIGVPLMMVFSVIFISAGGGLRGYLGGQVVSGVIVLGLLAAGVRSFTPAQARLAATGSSKLPFEVWAFSASMLGIGTMEFMIVQVDKITLGYFATAREVGIYSLAAAVVAFVPLVLNSVNQIFSPIIADLHTRGELVLLQRLFQSLTKWVVGLTLPLAAVVMMFARPMMRIFGHDFESGWPVLVIGTAGQLVNCGVGSVGFLLLMSGNEKRLIRVQAATTAVMIAGSILLVPWLGMVGAATAAAAANIVMNVCNLWQVRRALNISPYNRSYLSLLVPTIAMLALTALIRANITRFRHEWVAIGCTGMLAYAVFGCMMLAVGLDEDDRMIGGLIWRRLGGALGITS